MRHLFVSREYPPAPYPAGGIGTYVAGMTRLLAAAGETVHIIGQRWRGAPAEREEHLGGRLVVHRVPADEPVAFPGRASTAREMHTLIHSGFAPQAWSWNAGLLAESLVDRESIDVIEAQEWEAPLYHFLVRRAIGLGPTRAPPVVVHAHSPADDMWTHNEWGLERGYFLQMRRQESHCIHAADALLCASRFLATEVSQRFGVPPVRMVSIPYPLGTPPSTGHRLEERAGGSILYVGRLEPRKGVLELVDAALAVAGDDPTARFEFVGADLPYRDGATTREHLARRIPASLRPRFRFLGPVPRDQLGAWLGRARAVVIPSRWENFPNTCIEAMAAGVPVIASPIPALAELVEDGVTGWIAPSGDAAGLEAALRRAVSATSDDLTRMGEMAAVSIRQRCDNDSVVRQQLEFRTRLAREGASASLSLPTGSGPAPFADSSDVPLESDAQRGAERIVVTSTVRRSAGDPSHRHPWDGALGICVTDQRCRLEPGFLAIAQRLFETKPDLGIVTGWFHHPTQPLAPPSPAFPYQWFGNDAWPVVVVRASALSVVQPSDPALDEPFASWDRVNALLAAGWKSVTVPAIAASSTAKWRDAAMVKPNDDAAGASANPIARVRARMPDTVRRDAAALTAMLGAIGAAEDSGTLTPADRWKGISISEIRGLPARDLFALVQDAWRHPARSLAWARTQFRVRRRRSGDA